MRVSFLLRPAPWSQLEQREEEESEGARQETRNRENSDWPAARNGRAAAKHGGKAAKMAALLPNLAADCAAAAGSECSLQQRASELLRRGQHRALAGAEVAN